MRSIKIIQKGLFLFLFIFVHIKFRDKSATKLQKKIDICKFFRNFFPEIFIFLC